MPYIEIRDRLERLWQTTALTCLLKEFGHILHSDLAYLFRKIVALLLAVILHNELFFYPDVLVLNLGFHFGFKMKDILN